MAAAQYEAELKIIATKVLTDERITPEEGLSLLQTAPLSLLGLLANYIREKRFGNKTFFNRNFHIEPTNVCIFSCTFCAYSCSYKHKEAGWELSIEQMLEKLKRYDGKPITEVHIVGGVHPKMNLAYFETLLRAIKQYRPDLHIKGFTAVELDYMIRKAKVSVEEGLQRLNAAGLDSLPGGGAEIFAPEIRTQICHDKVDAQGWLHIHKTAHRLGMHSNATILYGHIESCRHRITHLELLRQTQDETGGFNTFIPLKFRNQNNEMSAHNETTLLEDMRFYAFCRIYLDNIAHLKAYWPMLGRHNAQLSLNFGVDDLDGTIDDSTKIYSMAGSEELNPALSSEELIALIKDAGRVPVERDTLYNELASF